MVKGHLMSTNLMSYATSLITSVQNCWFDGNHKFYYVASLLLYCETHFDRMQGSFMWKSLLWECETVVMIGYKVILCEYPYYECVKLLLWWGTRLFHVNIPIMCASKCYDGVQGSSMWKSLLWERETVVMMGYKVISCENQHLKHDPSFLFFKFLIIPLIQGNISKWKLRIYLSFRRWLMMDFLPLCGLNGQQNFSEEPVVAMSIWQL